MFSWQEIFIECMIGNTTQHPHICRTDSSLPDSPDIVWTCPDPEQRCCPGGPATDDLSLVQIKGAAIKKKSDNIIGISSRMFLTKDLILWILPYLRWQRHIVPVSGHQVKF